MEATVDAMAPAGPAALPSGDLDPLLPVRRRQRRHWEALATDMQDLFPAASTQYYRRREVALIRRYVGPLRSKRVLKLDLWNEAFNTRILHWMCDEGAHTWGIDVSRTITTVARRNARIETTTPPHMLTSDIRALPYKSDSFDFVYTMGTIEHIDEYADAVREVHRVLRGGGRAIIGVPHKWNIFLRPLLVTLLDAIGRYPYSPEKAFSARELRQVAERSGLRTLHQTGLLAIPGIVRIVDLICFRRGIRLQRLTPLFLWPFEYLETRFAWAARIGYLVAVVVEKPMADSGARAAAQ